MSAYYNFLFTMVCVHLGGLSNDFKNLFQTFWCNHRNSQFTLEGFHLLWASCMIEKMYTHAMSNNKYSIIISRTYFRSCHRFFNTNHTICFPSTNTSKKSLQSPKTIHNTMKQTKNLKRKLSESQLDVGCLIDPKIYFKHKPVNEVELWALGSAYQTVHYNVNNCISNAASIGN